ncbi:hypothetical protein CC78DRAFT_585938 [Lojkania enalia]|uniref:Uncharacterized protein n=1 Tax=Lojkania enalia TaxID=147567 RepID=A0A9P4MYN9_9PLEO|nr:hypothetical protein CC78DRAFT_585938 [Didymosphaeria enalia]
MSSITLALTLPDAFRRFDPFDNRRLQKLSSREKEAREVKVADFGGHKMSERAAPSEIGAFSERTLQQSLLFNTKKCFILPTRSTVIDVRKPGHVCSIRASDETVSAPCETWLSFVATAGMVNVCSELALGLSLSPKGFHLSAHLKIEYRFDGRIMARLSQVKNRGGVGKAKAKSKDRDLRTLEPA